MHTESPTPLPKIYVTGANGYLGRNLVREFRAAGHEVVSLVRTPRQPNDLPFSLDADFDFSVPEPGAVVHCAWDMARTDDLADERNVGGSRRFLDEARAHGFGPLIFVSSTSVIPGATSHYARSKARVEALCREIGAFVVRPGLVVSPENDGGMIAKLKGIVTKLPVVPLIGGGRQQFYVSDVRDLATAMRRLIEAPDLYDEARPVLAHPRPLAFRDVLASLAKTAGHRRLYVPVPAAPIRWLLAFAEFTRLPLPVKRDNLDGMLALPVAQPVNESLSASFRTLP